MASCGTFSEWEPTGNAAADLTYFCDCVERVVKPDNKKDGGIVNTFDIKMILDTKLRKALWDLQTCTRNDQMYLYHHKYVFH